MFAIFPFERMGVSMADATDHERSEAVGQAALWLVSQPIAPTPIIPHLQRSFGLSAGEACRAIAEANLLRRAAA